MATARRWDTRVGSIQLRVPRVRDGSYFPSLLEPRRRAERALVAVVQEAYVQGVSTRRVDELAQALGLNGSRKSQVSLLCQEVDAEVERFRSRPLSAAAYPYLWLDATFLKGRQQGRVVAQAVVMAIGVHAQSGQREVLGLDVGPSEEGAFWLGDLARVSRSPACRRAACRERCARRPQSGDLLGLAWRQLWQRCRVHFVRNALALVPKSAAQLVAATIRTVFAQPAPAPAMARQQWRHVADSFRSRYPKLAALLDDADTDVLA